LEGAENDGQSEFGRIKRFNMQIKEVQSVANMITAQDKERRAISQTTSSLALGAVIGFGFSAFEAYTLFSNGGFGDPRKTLTTIVSLMGSMMLLAMIWFLKNGSKKALYCWLVGLGLGLSRWLFIDKSFAVTLPAILLLVLFGYVTWQLARWVRSGALS
jgi:hypothetical protein